MSTYMQLRLAIMTGNTDRVAKLLKTGTVGNVDRFHCGKTPLMLAAERTNVDIVSLLLQHGADVDLVDQIRDSGKTSLHRAVSTDWTTVLEQAAAAAAAEAAERFVPSEHTNAELVRFLINQPDEAVDRALANNETRAAPFQGVLHHREQQAPAAVDPLAIIRLLLVDEEDEHAQVANPNVQDQNGDAPLHLAYYKGSLEIATLLLQHGANVNLRDADGSAVLDYAAEDESMDFLRLFLQHGGNVHHRNPQGQTLLHQTVTNAAVVKLLLEWGASPNTMNPRNGKVPLDIACERDRVGSIYLLFQRMLADGSVTLNEKYRHKKRKRANKSHC